MAKLELILKLFVVFAAGGCFAGIKASQSWSHDPGTAESSNAANHVNDRGAGKINGSCIHCRLWVEWRQPSGFAPDPVHTHWVDPRRHSNGVNEIWFQSKPLGHCAAHNRTGRARERHAKEPASPLLIGNQDVFDSNESIGVGTKRVTIRHCVSHQPPRHRTDRRVHHVFEQDILHISSFDRSRFQEGEASLHEKYQTRGDEQPHLIHIVGNTKRTPVPFIACLFHGMIGEHSTRAHILPLYTN
mmetsp:Transcript_9013/g.14711  ORF Transcript_9013/g.14711 Transcript_9013/m.14711 type:complete len:244 (+) Transcript_9013:690-1421(+)